jgi:hypothetical protein
MIFSVRINGIQYPHIDIRFAIVDGYPGGPVEVAIFDPNLGEVTLTNDCLIEVQHAEGQPWCPISAKGLAELADKEKSKIIDF